MTSKKLIAPRSLPIAAAHLRQLLAVPPSKLPIYVPSEAERKDPALYANNMREYMVRGRGQQAGREEGTRGPVAGLAAARESKSVRFAPEQRVVTPR